MRISLIFMILSLGTFGGCGGGSSSGGDLLIEGRISEGGGDDHKSLDGHSILKHGAGENIEEVKICALGKCSVSDSLGQWGFGVDKSHLSKDVLFTINGHGINTATAVKLPDSAKEVFIHFEHHNGKVIVHHMEVNGERAHESNHGDHSHVGHSHS
mgnify:CR=1 FL=1